MRHTSGGPVLTRLRDAVGQTPVLRLGLPSTFPVLLKLEHLSPTGSGKDRLAVAALDALEQSGRLQPGQALVIPSSGNTAVSMAWACSTRGHAVHAVIPRSRALEFRQLLALYGAKLELTASERSIEGSRERARELAAETGALLWDPFVDDAGISGLASIASEIAGLELSAIVCGLGSGLTLAALRRGLPGVPLIAVEPAEAPNGQLAPHKLHGLGVGFVPERVRTLENLTFATVSTAAAWAMKRRLAHEEGLFVGPTTGATVVAALEAAEHGPVLALAMDSGERAFSLEALVP